MSLERKTVAVLISGLRLLLFCLYLAINAGVHAWRLQQKTNTHKVRQNMQHVEVAQPEIYLLHSQSHGAAGANLLAQLREYGRQGGAFLEKAEPLLMDPADPYRVQISAQANGSFSAIAAFLYSIENSTPPTLIVEKMHLNLDQNGKVLLDILVAARAEYPRDFS